MSDMPGCAGNLVASSGNVDADAGILVNVRIYILIDGNIDATEIGAVDVIVDIAVVLLPDPAALLDLNIDATVATAHEILLTRYRFSKVAATYPNSEPTAAHGSTPSVRRCRRQTMLRPVRQNTRFAAYLQLLMLHTSDCLLLHK
jgi:hypothetical protein